MLRFEFMKNREHLLHIIGGCYVENCLDPIFSELFGSGLRAAVALSEEVDVILHCCVSEKYKCLLDSKSQIHDFKIDKTIISENVSFEYYHPLSTPMIYCNNKKVTLTPQISIKENVLYYGLLEADLKFNANYVVYDPQNQIEFNSKTCKAKHLALVLNKDEALILNEKGDDNDNLEEVGKSIMLNKQAEVVIIKNGPHGALLFEKNGITNIPVFETDRVWPIGSGDVFTAIFAEKWMIDKLSPSKSAIEASVGTAHYCESRKLPIEKNSQKLKELRISSKKRKIYLGGPFFSISERWLINESLAALHKLGNDVFSPMHDVGISIDVCDENETKMLAEKDLKGLESCDVVLAVVPVLDAGTIFEIGYAVALKKKVIVLAQDISKDDLFMLIGAGCDITDDFSTAIYKASW